MPIPGLPRRGSRVLIRAVESADEPAFTALARESRRFHAGWVRPASDSARFAVFLEHSRRDDFAALLLVRREDCVLLGAINLSQIVRGVFQNAYLDYWIGEPHARQGYMREGLALTLDHAFGPLSLHRLEANIQPGNEASRRLVGRLGFRLEGSSPGYLKIRGRWRAHERWAILQDEWRLLRSQPEILGLVRRRRAGPSPALPLPYGPR